MYAIPYTCLQNVPYPLHVIDVTPPCLYMHEFHVPIAKSRLCATTMLLTLSTIYQHIMMHKQQALLQ
jgi:hypothetical protein